MATGDGFGFGFIDFDKVMHAPPVFDLAKLIATGMFRGNDQARFQARKTTHLLDGYESVRALSDAELVALEGLAVLLNEETRAWAASMTSMPTDAELMPSRPCGSPGGGDPLGIRAARQSTAGGSEPPDQLALWHDGPDNPD